MYGDGDDESTFKVKKEYEGMIGNTYDKINNISEVINIFMKINDELKKNIKLIYELKFKLSDDSRLRQVEINTINAKIDDTLNFVCNKIYRKNSKNRISSKKVNIHRLVSLEGMHYLSDNIISELKNEILMIYLYMFKLYEKNIDKIHLINSELKEIMI